MNDITTLSKNQVFYERINILKTRGVVAKPTDFALIHGAFIDNKGNGSYVTRTDDSNGSVICVSENGSMFSSPVIDGQICTRPVIIYSSIPDELKNELYSPDGIMELEYGCYPQTAVGSGLHKKLNDYYRQSMLVRTGNTFFNPSSNEKYVEYMYENNKYLRIRAKLPIFTSVTLSNGISYKNDDIVWIKVEPVKFLIDKRNDLALSEKLLFNRKIYDYERPYDGNFKDTKLYNYLNGAFKNDLLHSLLEKDLIEVKQNKPSKILNDKKLSQYGIILNKQIYKTNPAIGRDLEIKELEKNLFIPKKGVVLVGSAGVGKTAIVEGLVYNIQNNLVCDDLKNKVIFSVDISHLLAGTTYRGDFEKKLNDLFEYVIKNPEIILFIDEMHNVMGAGSSDGQKLDMANILKPYISNLGLKVIGCTTTLEFEKIKDDEAYRRRFNIIDVPELDYIAIKQILKENIKHNDFNIDINLSEYKLDCLCDLIIKLSKRKLKYTYKSNNNPDASINILMYCFAYFKVTNIKNPTLEDFIDGIKDNKNLNLTDFDKSSLPTSKDNEEMQNRNKIKLHTN